MMRHQLSELGVDTAKMPLGDIQQRTIDAGFQALAELEVCQNRPTHCVGHMSVAHAKLKLPFQFCFESLWLFCLSIIVFLRALLSLCCEALASKCRWVLRSRLI